MIVCTFAGHRELLHPRIDIQVKDAVESLLARDSAFLFLTGGMGDFDKLCAACVRAAKRRHPQLDIRLALVLSYLNQGINRDKSYYDHAFDEVIIPAELAGVHPKAAISKRNRWMIEQSDYVISYVHRDFGGAANSVKYANKLGKMIIRVIEGGCL